jgi:hypothetical protein
MKNSNLVLHATPANGLAKAYACMKSLGAAAILALAASASAVAQSSGPQFSSNAPTAGIANGTLYVFIPIVNNGGTLASLLQIQSASLGGTAALTPVMPVLKGTMAPAAVTELELRFDAAHFLLGSRYLLTVRGTYQVGTSTYGFTVNRFLTVQDFTAAELLVLAHFESADAIEAELQSLPGIDFDKDNQTLLAFIRSRPEFSASGINGRAVWARFSDGKLILVTNGDRPNPLGGASGSGSTRASPALGASAMRELTPPQVAGPKMAPAQTASDPAPPTGLPVSLAAIFFTALDSPDWGVVDLINDIYPWLDDAGYSSGPYILASVSNLKSIGGQGVVFLNSHGGWAGGVAGQPNVFGIWTTTPRDFGLDLTDPDLQIPEGGTFPPLVWMNGLKEVITDPVTNKKTKITEWHYAITPQFVTTYWKEENGGFDPSSFVFIDACDSDNPKYAVAGGGNFKEAVFNAGAGVYAGWTGQVLVSVAEGATKLVFDRLLGADKFCYENGVPACETGPAPGADADPPVYAQRPFDYASVQYDLTQHTWHGIPLSAPAGVALNFTPNPMGSTFGLLAPSIANMVESTGTSSDTLLILGNFGNAPGTVQLAGSDLSCSWGSYAITCTLPPAGGGPVIVSVNDHKSNPAALTLWQAPWNFSANGPGSIFESIVFNLQFRNDIRKYRRVIHKDPIEPQAGPFRLLSGSTGTFSCSGQAVYRGETFSWVGSGSISPLPARSNVLIGAVRLVDSRDMNIILDGSETFCTGTIAGVSGPVGIGFPSLFAPLLSAFPVLLDKDANILASPGTGVTTTTAGWYFPPGTAQGIVRWNKIAPAADTGPDPHSPR